MKSHLYIWLSLAVGLTASSCSVERHTTSDISMAVTTDIDSNVHNVVLFVYDPSDRLVGHQVGDLSSEFDLSVYQQYDSVRIVAWGNVGGSRMKISAAERSTARLVHRIALGDSLERFASHQLSCQPTDLFYGSEVVAGIYFDGDDTYGHNRYIANPLHIKRAVSSYTITARNIRRAFGDHPSGYKLLIRHPHSGLDYWAQSVDGESFSVPASTYDSLRDELTTGVVLALPTGDEQLGIDLYSSDGQMLYSSVSDSPSKGVRLDVGMKHDIVLDFMTEQVIITNVVGWDEEIVEQPFD